MRTVSWCWIVLALAGPAAAAPGDPRVVEGTLIWPEGLPGGDTAVVHDDHGVRYQVRLGATTSLPAALHAGDRVIVKGQESTGPTDIVSTELSRPLAARPTTTAPAPLLSVDGMVMAVSGSTLILLTRDGTPIAVDVSSVRVPADNLLRPGRDVTVFGVVRDGMVLVAKGLTFNHTSSALPDRPPM